MLWGGRPYSWKHRRDAARVEFLRRASRALLIFLRYLTFFLIAPCFSPTGCGARFLLQVCIRFESGCLWMTGRTASGLEGRTGILASPEASEKVERINFTFIRILRNGYSIYIYIYICFVFCDLPPRSRRSGTTPTRSSARVGWFLEGRLRRSAPPRWRKACWSA